jgi:hypothetical protein
MALVVQDDTGTIAGANAYIDLTAFKAYHDARANVYTTDDAKVTAAIIKATDYLDTRFRFIGVKLATGQTTQWPRQAGAQIFLPWWDINFLGPDVSFSGPSAMVQLSDASGNPITGIPQAVKDATAEYALRALSQPLFQDAPAPVGGRMIASHKTTVDVISEEIVYAPSQGTGQFQMPAFPAADMKLSAAGLIELGRSVYR